MSLSELQLKISQAIFERKPYDESLNICGGEKAFSIYRNNIFVSLINTLRELYPQTALLCGDNFVQIAREFIEVNAPTSAHLLYYGGDFAEFIAKTDIMLRQVAEYERCCNLSYAADKESILTAEDFLQYDEETRMGLDVRLTGDCFITRPVPFSLAEALCSSMLDHDILAKSGTESCDCSIFVTRHGASVLSFPISLFEAYFLQDVLEGKFATGLIRFIESSETAQSRLGEFFSLSIFRLG